LKHGSLFSGIGGFDLAAERVGFENIFQVEIDPFCQKVLTKNFPGIKKYLDIKDFDGTEYRGKVDIISGGFPCQPFSIAGKGEGDKDPRALFPQMLRVIGEAKPRWVVAENVGGIISNKNGKYFEEVCTQLEDKGYSVQSFIIPASAVNAPHKRNRIWIIAHTNSNDKRNNGREIQSPAETNEGTLERENGKRLRRGISTTDINASNTKSEQLQKTSPTRRRRNRTIFIDATIANANNSTPARQRGNGGEILSITKSERLNNNWEESWYEVATRFCRVDDGVSNRVDRLKGLGNAIVPQIAQIIFETIKQMELN